MRICTSILSIIAVTTLNTLGDLSKTKPPTELSWKTFDSVIKHASQQESEQRYHKVDWKNSVVEAQREAHKADKPILMILFFGDHRSNC